MATKSTNLIGRKVLINWHSFDPSGKQYGGDIAKLVQAYRDGHNGTMNALYRGAADHFNQEAEIIGLDADGGWRLLFADGTVGPSNEMFFIVLPAAPAPVQAWEYKTGQATAFDAEALNKFGAEGWELISLLLVENTFSLCFKRPAQITPAAKPAKKK